MDLSTRVARRYRSSRGVALRYAVLVTDKWFREQKVKLRDILKQQLRKDVSWWGYSFPDKVIHWFDDFEADFLGLVSQDKARESIKTRVKGAKDYVEAITEKLNNLTNLTRNVDFQNTESFLKWYAAQECHELLQEKLTTIGDLFKWSYYIDESIVNRLVQRTMKMATPEELAMLTDERDTTGRKYQFLYRIGYKQSALKALKRNKLDAFDPNKWVDRVYEMLEANYAEKALESGDGLTEFELHGMKVVVDDRTVDEADTRNYIKFLNEAYETLARKGFKSAWYGTVFIRCKECGGDNPHGAQLGVGGHYRIGPDTVGIFSRPSAYLVELMAHELGHRYWFKQMSQAQRAKFESLVQVKADPKLKDLLNSGLIEESVAAARKDFGEFLEFLPSALKRIKADFDAAEQYVPSGGTLTVDDSIANELQSAAMTSDVRYREPPNLYEVSVPAFRERIPQTNYKKAMEARDALIAHLEAFEKLPGVGEYEPEKAQENLKGIRAWLAEAWKLQALYLTPATRYLSEIEEGKERLPDPEDKRPVLPVSGYGWSNTDEAWAEVFAHYVLDMDMTRDQVDSFKSVLKLGHLPGSSSNSLQSQA